MLVSVIIPLFNKAAHIEETVRSVLVQSYRKFELIVVNDGSTDRGPEIARSFKDPRVRVIDQENAGVSAARNRGISATRGELVAFLDGDDLWNPDFLAAVLRLNRQYPLAGLYATAYQIRRRHRGLIDPQFKEIPSPPWEGIMPRYFRSAALGKPPVCASACCAPRHVLNEVGGFAAGRRMGEDLDLWARIALRYPVAFSTYKGAVYGQDAENRACMTFGRKDEHPFFETAERLQRTGGISEQQADDVELYLTRLTIENIRQHVLAGDFDRARELSRTLKKRWAFPIWRLIWGSPLSGFARRIWYFRHVSLERA